MRENLDPVIKTDQCAQYVDEIGIAANDMTQLIKNVRAVFNHKAGLILTIAKCSFGMIEVEFLGTTIAPDGIAPQDHEVTKCLASIRLAKSKNKSKKTSCL